MADSEPHEVLGVARDASEDDVRAAYREMVKEHHPDVSDAEDAEERFVRIREAYEAMRERAEERTATGKVSEKPTGNGSVGRARGSAGPTNSEAKTKAEHKRRKREKRKRWEDPWGKKDEENKQKKDGKGSAGRERVDGMGYGWTLFKEGGGFFISKNGGRGRVYIDRDGGSTKNKVFFSSRSDAEAAYESHVERRDNQRRTIPLGNGWRVVKNAGGYAVEGREGYLGFDGKIQDKPYWFMSLEDAKEVYESRFGGERKETTDVKSGDESLASRVTVGAALLPFLATVTVLNFVSSAFGLGTKGKNPYLATGLTAVFFGTLAVVLESYSPLFSFILLSLAVWAGVEFVVVAAGPYAADEMDG